MQADERDQRITLAVTGASGARYGLRLMQVLLGQDRPLLVMLSAAARAVMAAEEGLVLPEAPDASAAALAQRLTVRPDLLRVYDIRDWFCPAASGSGAPRRMVVCPCSTGTLSAIAHGASDSLIERAADVVLKERGRLVLVPREMPLSAIHLENMLALSRLGAVIMPASPGFYGGPRTIEDLVDAVVGRVLDQLGIDNALVKRWGCE